MYGGFVTSLSRVPPPPPPGSISSVGYVATDGITTAKTDEFACGIRELCMSFFFALCSFTTAKSNGKRKAA